MQDPRSRLRLTPASEVLFNHLTPGRECGPCVACCEFEDINFPELRKPAGEMCQHNTGSGCGIYETRPACCRDWFCLWRKIDALPDEARPDKCGVAFELIAEDEPETPFARAYIMALALDSPEAFKHPLVEQSIRVFASEGSLPIWAGYRQWKMLIYPGPDIARAVVDPGAPTPPGKEGEVKRWRLQFGIKSP